MMKAECLHLIRLTVVQKFANQSAVWFAGCSSHLHALWLDHRQLPTSLLHGRYKTDIEVVVLILTKLWLPRGPKLPLCTISIENETRLISMAASVLASAWGRGHLTYWRKGEQFGVKPPGIHRTQIKKGIVFSGVREEKSQQHVSGNPSEISMFRLIQHVLTGGVNAVTTRCLYHFSSLHCAAETNNQKKGAVTYLFISALMSLCYFRHSSSILSLIKCATFKFVNTAIK